MEKKIGTNSGTVVTQAKHGKAYIPLGYYADFLKLVKDRHDLFEVITYDDLPWGDDWDWAGGYPIEYKNWCMFLEKGENKKKIYILLQHDVDSYPERSWECVRMELSMGLRSNVMLFHRRINRRKFEQTGIVEETEYPVDVGLLKEAENRGFCICYHSNAWDQGQFDRDAAHQKFREDVGALRSLYKVGYFSAHGGLRSGEGLTNNCLDAPKELQGSLRWVHNGASPKFQSQWSDGGINSLARDPNSRDLRDFVKTMVPGKRYRILTHPQYYDWQVAPEKCQLWNAEWFRLMAKQYRVNDGGSVWKEVAEVFRSPQVKFFSIASLKREGYRLMRRLRRAV